MTWKLAIAFFVVGIVLMAAPAFAQAVPPESTFSWGQVCILCAVAAAWGDSRAQMREIRKDVDELKKERDE